MFSTDCPGQVKYLLSKYTCSLFVIPLTQTDFFQSCQFLTSSSLRTPDQEWEARDRRRLAGRRSWIDRGMSLRPVWSRRNLAGRVQSTSTAAARQRSAVTNGCDTVSTNAAEWRAEGTVETRGSYSQRHLSAILWTSCAMTFKWIELHSEACNDDSLYRIV